MRRLLPLLALCLGCSAPPVDLATGSGPAPPPPAPEVPPPVLVAAGVDGGVALVDVGSGRPLARAAEGVRVHDLVIDRAHLSVFTFELDEDEGGTLVERSLLAGAFGVPRVRARLDGRARVLPTLRGPLLFEASYGERWALLGDDGRSRPTLPWRLPASFWAAPDGSIEALLPDEEGWSLARVELSGAMLVPRERKAYAAAGESARALRRTSGIVTVSALGAAIEVRESGRVLHLAVPAHAIVDACELDDGALAMLVEPPRLVVRAAASDTLVALSLDRTLPGGGGRALIDLGGGRVLIGTEGGLLVVRRGAALAPEPGFDPDAELTAPVDGPIARPR